MSQLGQSEKASLRAYVFRFAPDSRHGSGHRFCRRFVPQGRIGALFDHVIDAGKQGWRNVQAKGGGCFEVDYHLELCRLHDRQFGGFFPFQDTSGVCTGLPVGTVRLHP